MNIEFLPGSPINSDYLTRFEAAAEELDQDLAAAADGEVEPDKNVDSTPAIYSLNAILDAFEDWFMNDGLRISAIVLLPLTVILCLIFTIKQSNWQFTLEIKVRNEYTNSMD